MPKQKMTLDKIKKDKKTDAYFQEMLMLSKKVDRQERWIQIIAKKVGVKLEY